MRVLVKYIGSKTMRLKEKKHESSRHLSTLFRQNLVFGLGMEIMTSSSTMNHNYLMAFRLKIALGANGISQMDGREKTNDCSIGWVRGAWGRGIECRQDTESRKTNT